MKKNIAVILILSCVFTTTIKAQTYFPMRNGETNINPVSNVNGQWIAVFPSNNTLGSNYYQGISFGFDVNNYASLVNGISDNDLYFGKWSGDWKGWRKIIMQNEFGNVGIGTNNPNSRLDLGKGYGVNGAKLLIYNDDNTSELSGTKCGFYMDNFRSNNLNLIFPEAPAYPGLFTISGKNTAGTTLNPYFSIAGLTGNVGIGTINPDAKLTVNGTIHSKEVKVDASIPVPDYVFANDYKLKTLQEVEDYIKENNHLPEVPSAKEMEKNGLMLAEMNMTLLKKIEELTLYSIDQEKKSDKMIQYIEIQNKLIIEQNKRLDKLEKK